MSRPSALIPNSYQTPNVIVDKLLRHLSCPQAKVLMVICRQTFGWHKHEVTISLSQFDSLEGISRSSANKALRVLEESTLVIKTSGKGPRLMNAWSFNLSTDPDVVLSRLKSRGQTGADDIQLVPDQCAQATSTQVALVQSENQICTAQRTRSSTPREHTETKETKETQIPYPLRGNSREMMR
jgi:hypothetical protein